VDFLLEQVSIPPLYPVRQTFAAKELDAVEAEVNFQLRESGILGDSLIGKRIAIAVGSRGVARIADVTRAVVAAVRDVGGDPFIVPAMGSHGGATAEGQTELLVSLGVTESTVGAPVRASMDVVQVGQLDNGLPVYVDQWAHGADGIIVINRIKPHTAFRGPYESGLLKMITIGLGKQKGAQACHAQSFAHMAVNIQAMARVIAEKVPILGGVGTIENAYDRVAEIHVLSMDGILTEEPALLERAKSFMPSLFTDEIDVLVVDEIGKNISGDGMDPNITGRYPTPYASGGPNVRRIAVLGLTEQSHGNANGIGMADVTTERVLRQIDWQAGYMNALTSTVLAPVRMPMVMPSDQRAIQAAIVTCNARDLQRARVMRIVNTLSLGQIWVSEVLADEARALSHTTIEGPSQSLRFDENGNVRINKEEKQFDHS